VTLAIGKLPKVSGDAQPFTDPGLVKVLDEAEKLAKKAGDSFVPVERILMALAMVPGCQGGAGCGCGQRAGAERGDQ
jgi:ATP-dependent Clp protease ATP-binding subunit ClpB